MSLTFIDLFSGIGGFRLGMEMAGHTCKGHCEIDKFANKSYIAMHNPKEDEWYANDIRNVEPGDLPEVDCYCGGFPCQAFSVAGKRGGFEDTRGTLFFEIMRLAKVRKPKYLFFENVPGLLSHDGGRTFGTILATMGELGYEWEYQICNSKNFGVPQNRERVFIIGHIRNRGGRKVFPFRESNSIYNQPGENKKELHETALCLTAKGQNNWTGSFVLQKTHGNCVTVNYEQTGTLQAARIDKVPCVEVRAVLTPDREEKRQNGRRIKEPGEPMFTLTAQDKHGVMIKCINPRKEDGTQTYQQDRIYDAEGHLPAMSAQLGGRFNVLVKEATKQGYAEATEGDSINLAVPRSETRRGRVGKGVANTLDTSCNQGTLVQGRIRRLTPKECFRLQGFPDEYFERASEVNSDSQLYKQAGNSVTVNVIYEIAKRLE